MLFTSYLALALPMASIVCGELTESVFRSRISRGIFQHQEHPRKAMSVSSLKSLAIDTIALNAVTVATGTNYTVSFNVADPNSNTSTTCTKTWTDTASSSTRPTSYVTCATSNATFEHWQWYFAACPSYTSFTLQIDHTYTDNDVGQAPYNKLSTFSRANATLTCGTDNESGLPTPCQLPSESKIVPAPVYGLSA